MNRITCLTAVILLAAAGAVAQAAEFYPISSVTSSTNNYFAVENLIEGPGVGYDAVEPHDAMGATWVTDAPGGFPSDYIAVAGAPVLEFDLGAEVSLSEISIWGYSAGNSNGLTDFTLQFATEADGLGGYGSIAYQPSFSLWTEDLIPDATPRHSFAFAEGVTARYVQLTADDNFFVAPGDGSAGEVPGGDRVGIGEVAFQVPEPSTLVLAALALLGFAFYGWRKK